MEIVSYVGFNGSRATRGTDVFDALFDGARSFLDKLIHGEFRSSSGEYDFTGMNPSRRTKGASAHSSRLARLRTAKAGEVGASALGAGSLGSSAASVGEGRGIQSRVRARTGVFSSFRIDVRALSEAVSRGADFASAHSRVFLMAAAAALCTVLLSVALLSVYGYYQTVPSLVSFEHSAESEFELLDKALKSFAMDEVQDYTADGTLVGTTALTDREMEKLFRRPVTYSTYKVQSGDTISGITKKFGLKNISTLIAVNDIGNVRQLCAGQKLKIPSMDGLLYTVQKGNSLAGLSSRFGVTMEDLLDVNDLESSELSVGQSLFIPGAKMDTSKLQQAMGELFKCPIEGRYRLTSYFGPRADPFTGARSNHTGIDMACPTGTPILATSSGTVAFSGVSPVFGNYVIIKHSNGYQSLYGHMSKIIAKKGQWVSQGTRIGLVGSTGYSTGPHLHFTVYKNGKLVDPLSLINKK